MAQKSKRNKVALNVYVDPALVDRLDEWVNNQELRPNKTALVEMLLKRFLDDQAQKRKER